MPYPIVPQGKIDRTAGARLESESLSDAKVYMNEVREIR
jgi:hypothetical protein